jgi:amidophosphoribosyltransferase
VLEGKRVFLVEDSIVRSTTMRVLLDRIREAGGAKEIHVRVACPPIVAPCFYGIDMSTISELFAPKFLENLELTAEAQDKMAEALGANTLRYLPRPSIAKAINLPREELCQACIDAHYPTPYGEKLYQIALQENGAPAGNGSGRTYE